MITNNTMENGDIISVEFTYDGNTLIADAKIEQGDYILTKRFTSDAAEMISGILSSPDMEKGGVVADYFHKDRKRYVKRAERPEVKSIFDAEVTLDKDDLK